MTIIIAILATLYICVGIGVYIFLTIYNDFVNGVGAAFGWSTPHLPRSLVLEILIIVLFWPILLIVRK